MDKHVLPMYLLQVNVYRQQVLFVHQQQVEYVNVVLVIIIILQEVHVLLNQVQE